MRKHIHTHVPQAKNTKIIKSDQNQEYRQKEKVAVHLLTAWWHCGSQLLQTNTAQAFAVFTLSALFPLSPVILNSGLGPFTDRLKVDKKAKFYHSKF